MLQKIFLTTQEKDNWYVNQKHDLKHGLRHDVIKEASISKKETLNRL